MPSHQLEILQEILNKQGRIQEFQNGGGGGAGPGAEKFLDLRSLHTYTMFFLEE